MKLPQDMNQTEREAFFRKIAERVNAGEKLRLFLSKDHQDLFEAIRSEGQRLTSFANYRVGFMHELVDGRIMRDYSDKTLWDKNIKTGSIEATGRTQQGNAVVVYAHIPNYLSEPANTREASSKVFVESNVRLSREEFERLLNEDGKTDETGNRIVWVFDYESLKKDLSCAEIQPQPSWENYPRGMIAIPTNRLLEQRIAIAFLGGEQRAQRYQHKFSRIDSTVNFEINNHLDEDSPTGSLLSAGYIHGSSQYDNYPDEFYDWGINYFNTGYNLEKPRYGLGVKEKTSAEDQERRWVRTNKWFLDKQREEKEKLEKMTPQDRIEYHVLIELERTHPSPFDSGSLVPDAMKGDLKTAFVRYVVELRNKGDYRSIRKILESRQREAEIEEEKWRKLMRPR